MLFSDIEGSTLLLSRLGPAYAEALDAQRKVLREAWADPRWYGDGHRGGQLLRGVPHRRRPRWRRRRRRSASWRRTPGPAGEQVRVRMGIHTGSPYVHDGGYVGMDVHRAARIAGAAHGGQVVVSAATAELVRRELPDGVRTARPGIHQLKDIPAAEHLFQLTIDGLAGRLSAA